MMPLRKQTVKEESDVPSENQQVDENAREHEAHDDGRDKDELSSSLLPSSSVRHKRRREREDKSKEMTEEEMMDLALRLSEQEATSTALRVQQEEEAMMKAIQESMVGQTQACPPSKSQSLLVDANASLRLCSRRKLLYSNGMRASATEQEVSEDACTAETDLNRGAKGSGDEKKDGNKKRKRKEGSPLLEMPDLSQAQKMDSSPCSSESLSLRLDSPQSSDSTQIEDRQLRKSPVFPSTGFRAEVQVPRLSRDLLETCRSSGFVLCSQDSWTSTQVLLPAQPRSPTFPKSPKSCVDLTPCPKSPVFSETKQGDAAETELSPECLQSPVSGRTTQRQGPSSACESHPTCENSGFTFSSQGSLTPSVRSTSCRPQSPVFPRSPIPPKNPIPTSPTFPETGPGQVDQSHGSSTSPVFGWTGPRCRTRLHRQRKSEGPPPSEQIRDPQSPRQDHRMDPEPDDRFDSITSPRSVDAPELNKQCKDWNSSETELTSDMTLLWSDEDHDVTPVGSPSPVFPEERPVHQAEVSPGKTRSNGRFVLDRSLLKDRSISLRPSSSASSTSTCRQQPSTTERAADEPKVHYYWGVPFCPRGLDPDAYTQVILAQMQVYDRSLKQAQRGLLRKAQWGEPILPQPEKSPSPEPIEEPPQRHVTRRRGLRLRGNKLSEDADASPAEEEEEEGKKDRDEEEEREEENKAEEEKAEGRGGEGTMDADDCDVCPETQLDNDDDDTQDLTLVTDAAAKFGPGSPALPEVEMIPRDSSPAGGVEPREEEMEVDAPVEEKVQTDEVTDPDMEEVNDKGLQRSTYPELESAAVPPSPETTVDCPICQGSFPATKIEMHAAYCDGEVAVVDERRPEVDCFQASLKSRRKRTRRGAVTADGTNHSSSSDQNQEKCYICQKSVLLREYSRHTELCLRRRPPRTDAVSLPARPRGNLLSALEQTENRDSGGRASTNHTVGDSIPASSKTSEAGPSGSRLQPGEVIDLRDDDDDDEEGGSGVPAFRISNSPIRSFTPISEATDCLIDFKKQQRTKRPSQRRR